MYYLWADRGDGHGRYNSVRGPRAQNFFRTAFVGGWTIPDPDGLRHEPHQRWVYFEMGMPDTVVLRPWAHAWGGPVVVRARELCA